MRQPRGSSRFLHLIGVDHDRLTYRLAGLDLRLTGVEHTSVVKGAGVWAFS